MKIEAKKSLGQNFLNDNNILNKIACSTNAATGDLIIEIGPGKGALTEKLIKTGADVIAFEIDERMRNVLDSIKVDNLKIIYGDFLQYDLSSIDTQKYNNIYVIANIPYYISTPIIKKIIEANIDFKEIVLLVQKEYAERICAHPKTRQYDSLTVFVNYHYDVANLFLVNRNCFTPSPNVDSSVIKLFNRKKYDKDIENKFLNFVNIAFTQKRKTLKNNLFNYNWEIIEKFLLENNHSLTARPEELSVDEYIELFQALSL